MTMRVDAHRGCVRLATISLALLAAASPGADALVLTGEVQAAEGQSIYTPPSDSWPVVLRFYAPEGKIVTKGEVVLRIDAGSSVAQVRDMEGQIEQVQAKVAKEVAALEVKRVDAELALVDAEAKLATSRIDAALPRELISGLDHDRYQGELERATREAALKRREVADAANAVERRREDGALEERRLQMQRDYHAAQVAAAAIVAERDGVLVHGFDPRSGTRIDEGSDSQPGAKVGEIVSEGQQRIRAWVIEPDRQGLRVGQGVDLRFDALPGSRATGRVARISGVPQAKPEWGEGQYFVLDIDFEGKAPPGLLPGMSTRVDVTSEMVSSTPASAAAPRSGVSKIGGR